MAARLVFTERSGRARVAYVGPMPPLNKFISIEEL